MTEDLNTGKGRCHGTARLFIKPVQAVIELSASQDVLQKALAAVHHANRHANVDDFIAIALPAMHMGRNCMRPGHEIELIGSDVSLATFLALEGPQSLVRRGMIQPAEIDETFVDPGMIGAAYIRDRASEKYTSGWMRRNKERAERRGKPWKDGAKPRANDPTALALHYGSTVLHVRQVVSEMTDTRLMVSTYGFSSAALGCHAVLPVFPEAAKEAHNAA